MNFSRLSDLFSDIIEYAENLDIENESEGYPIFIFNNVSDDKKSMTKLIDFIDEFSIQYNLATGKNEWQPFWNLIHYFKSKMHWSYVKGGKLTITPNLVNLKNRQDKCMLQAMVDPNLDVLLVVSKNLDNSSFGDAIDESDEMRAYRIF